MIAIGSDHAGYHLKESIKKHLDKKGIQYKDFGCHSEERAEYASYAEKVANAVSSGEYEKGLLFCGTGIGMSIAANKVKGIRAVVCSECYSAIMSRRHNDANILALGGRVVGVDLAAMIVDMWLDTPFEGGRHKARVDMISEIEGKNIQKGC
ncbi:MAG: ribose 5-phosphate isomerase B [Xylanivirga thermophila]|uniref:ribose 5-phosphate isomerase B n=1 Tax=Xylanivirga thermophila TaxID=2496273 RepID=UPI00101C1314|nr:ribose 5-phosphate isomerase B [Xylanivirga thermophila]